MLRTVLNSLRCIVHRSVLVLVACSILFSTLASQPLPPGPLKFFDSAMATVGLEAEEITFDQLEMKMWQGDRWRMDFATLLHSHPLAVPRHTELLRSQLAENASVPLKLVQNGARLLGHPVRRGLIDNPIVRYQNFPDSVPKQSFTNSRNIVVGPELRTTRNGVDLLMRIIEDREFSLRQALDGVNANKYRKRLTEYFNDPDKDTTHTDQLIESLADTLDYDLLMAAVQDLVVACQMVADSFLGGKFPEFLNEVKSRQGMVYVGTSGDDAYAFVEAPLLIVDGGGNDSYSFPGRNSDFPLTIIIDAGGNDTYTSLDSTVVGIGGAVCGVSILFDLGGNDRHVGSNVCQGSALFGAAVVYDRSGNDLYRAKKLSQGSGAFGLGMLIDTEGTDSLYAHQQAQGFGYTQGVGIVVNGSGNDIYIAEDSIPLERSSQSKDHNVTLAQGAGYGRRADYINGHSWAGGIGVLADIGGDDRYSCGVFGQGVGYWYSVGMLLDAAGNDRYNGVWYVQGAAAHFAVGVLEDAAGDDTYTALLNMAHGAGHDFSLGWLIEHQGNDNYTSPNLSLGAGNDNGIGICWERLGSDTYTSATEVSLGAARTAIPGLRLRLLTLGLFLDEAGDDQFKSATTAKNSSHWFGRASDVDAQSPFFGIGFDR